MVWWWIANVVLLALVIPLVAFLAKRMLDRSAEVRDYAADILTHGLGITANLDPVPKLADTADLAGATRDAASRYASAVGFLLDRRR